MSRLSVLRRDEATNLSRFCAASVRHAAYTFTPSMSRRCARKLPATVVGKIVVKAIAEQLLDERPYKSKHVYVARKYQSVNLVPVDGTLEASIKEYWIFNVAID